MLTIATTTEPLHSLLQASLSLFSLVFGTRFFTDARLVKKLLPLIGVAVLPIVFLVVFVFFRAFFMNLNPAQQAFAGPLWPLIKMLLKKLCTKLVDKGKNPDAAPFMHFCFDSAAALSGNFLFLSASDVSSVLTMISVDVIENLILALRVAFMVQESRSKSVEREMERKDKRIEALEQNLEWLDKNDGMLYARITRLETNTRAGVELEVRTKRATHMCEQRRRQ